MDPRLEALLTRQRAGGFADVRGATADVSIPISDRLLNEVIAQALPALPPVNLTLAIERQPELPASPILVLRLELGGLLAMAGSALRFLDALPPGITVEQDRIHVNLSTLLAERGLAELLDYAEHVQVTTTDGAVVVAIRAAVRASGVPRPQDG